MQGQSEVVIALGSNQVGWKDGPHCLGRMLIVLPCGFAAWDAYRAWQPCS